MKIFSKVLNTHLYINQNETKQEVLKKITYHMTHHLIQHAH
jgi:hypothetical protein